MQIHTELLALMEKRDNISAPPLGTRIPYVIRQGGKDEKVSKRGEDPLYALDNDIPLDFDYYLKKQLEVPLTRLFGPIMKDPSVLFTGDHTKERKITIPKTGPLAKFFVKLPSCIKCGLRLESDEDSNLQAGLCGTCKMGREEFATIIKEKHCKRSKDNEDNWNTCKKCQGDEFESVICVNRQCDIFYKRLKSKKDVFGLEEKMKKLDISW